MMKPFDSHAHVSSLQFKEDLNEVINDSIDKLSGIIEVGCDIEAIPNVLELASRYENFIFPAIGIHPTNADEYSEEFEKQLINLIKSKKIVALGEIGIDLYWDTIPFELQDIVFRKQLAIAKKYDIPVIIHSRDAFNESYNILKEFAPIKGVMHSFSGDVIEANKIIELGLLIGLSGPITFKNGLLQREVAKNIPLEYIIVETDSPYLTPVPFRGKRNMPSYVTYVAEAIAIEKCLTLNEVIEQTNKNVRRVFLEGKDV